MKDEANRVYVSFPFFLNGTLIHCIQTRSRRSYWEELQSISGSNALPKGNCGGRRRAPWGDDTWSLVETKESKGTNFSLLCDKGSSQCTVEAISSGGFFTGFNPYPSGVFKGGRPPPPPPPPFSGKIYRVIYQFNTRIWSN